MKRTAADKHFSNCIRAANDYICERCGKDCKEDKSKSHCSHNYKRNIRSIRFYKYNALCLCNCCHKWYEDEVIDSGIWINDYMGADVIEKLREARNTKRPITIQEEKKKIAKHYLSEHKRIKKLRDQGVKGYIDFTCYFENEY